MSRSLRGLRRKAKNAFAYLVALLVFLPGVILILGLLSGVQLALVGALLTIYYLVAFFVIAAKGLNCLEGVLS